MLALLSQGLPIQEPGCFLMEPQRYLSSRPVAVLGYDNISFALGISLVHPLPTPPLLFGGIRLLPVDEHHYIGVLLDAPAVPQVGELGPVGRAQFHGSAKLGYRHYRRV